MIASGIDLGTSAIKIVFLDNADIVSLKVIPAVPENILGINQIFIEELKKLSLSGDDFLGVATTGYGKRFFHNPKLLVDEITALAVGVCSFADNKAKAVINVGGQDIKFLRISETGRVIDFKMNDKCAAGTGKFFDMMSQTLQVPLDEFGALGSASKKPVAVDCFCAVFAQTEVASLLYKSISKGDIIAGFHRAIARKLFEFTQGIFNEDEVYFDGGLAKNEDLISALKEVFLKDIKILPYPQFTSAIGAALHLLKKSKLF